MKKILSSCVLAVAVALMALSVSATTSEAKKAKKAKAPVACTMPGYKTVSCKGDLCATQRCGIDGKWYPAIPCVEAFCPPMAKS
jgi:hypothetical protein